MIDIKAIKAAAEAATPGPWIEAGPSYGEPKPRFFNSVVTGEDEDGDWLDICCSTSDNTDADMTHIATANPATILALLDRLEAAEVEVTEQARLLGISAEKELALRTKLVAAEKDTQLVRNETLEWAAMLCDDCCQEQIRRLKS